MLVERFNRLRNLLDGEKIRKRLSRTSSRQGIALAGPPAISPQNDVDNVQTLQAPNEPIANSPVQQAMPQVAQQGQSLELSQAARNMVDYQKRANFATRGGKYPQTANNDEVQSEQNASRQTQKRTVGRLSLKPPEEPRPAMLAILPTRKSGRIESSRTKSLRNCSSRCGSTMN